MKKLKKTKKQKQSSILFFLLTIAVPLIWFKYAFAEAYSECIFYQSLVPCQGLDQDGIFQPGTKIVSKPIPAIPFFAVGKNYSVDELLTASFVLRNESSIGVYYKDARLNKEPWRIRPDSNLDIKGETKKNLRIVHDPSLEAHFWGYRPYQETLDGENIRKFWENWVETQTANSCEYDCPTVVRVSSDTTREWIARNLDRTFGDYKGGISYCKQHKIGDKPWSVQNCIQVIRYHTTAILVRAAVETWREHESIAKYSDMDFRCSTQPPDLDRRANLARSFLEESPYLLRLSQRKLTKNVLKIIGLRRFEVSRVFPGYREHTSVEALMITASTPREQLNIEVTIGLHLTKLNSVKYEDYRIADPGEQVLYANNLETAFRNNIPCSIVWRR